MRHKNKPQSSHNADAGGRGVTRPHMHGGMQENDSSHGHADSDSGGMGREERMRMLHMHHAQTLWIYWLVVILGLWTVLSPLTFSYSNSVVEPGGGRDVWLTMEQRIAACKWSDVISGLLLLFFGARSLRPNRPVSMWICCFVGVWLNVAPIIFWAPSATIYINDTLVGMLVIALTVLIPGMPNMMAYMKMGAEVPPGWTYNPSSWAQRWIMIALGLAGWLVSRYLAAFQLGYLNNVWDPFFGNGSRQVLLSDMSRSWPISDAAFGTLAYTFEFLMGWMGSPSRWRTMPWMVTLFGILVIPLGLVHIILVISQPVVVGAWCTFCLLAAAIMLPMIPLEADEVVAMGQHMVHSTRRGEPFWRVFWKGGEPADDNKDERSPEPGGFAEHPGQMLKASIWGMSFPWTLLLSAVIGIALMAMPALVGLDITHISSDINHVMGAVIVVVAVVSMGEVLRVVRFANIVAGLSIGILPWLVYSPATTMNIINSIAGFLVILLAVPRGMKKERYGLWDRYVL